METTLTLKPETITRVQELVRLNRDSSEGFLQASRTIESTSIASLFRDLAAQRQGNAIELEQQVRLNGEETERSGTVAGTLHRWWLKARGALNGGDDHVVLIEAERGEDAIKHAYEQALGDLAASPLHDVLHRQYRDVKSGHDRIRNLRDSMKGT